MTDTAAPLPSAGLPSTLVRMAPTLFAVTVFTSAALIFLVEPMIAKLVLPTLGGSPAVWNTCMVFFQAALLLGYGYAHLLQRVKSLKLQTAIHACVLLVAALALPLRLSALVGAPSSNHPILWLLGLLAIAIGAPFAALSATAPLAQAWYARVRAGKPDAANPYVLYAASNLGSLIALLAYPTIVEPALRLKVQTVSWSLGYGTFFVLMALVALIAARAGAGASPMLAPSKSEAPPISWKDRLIWIGLAAIPSSLMLGVTTHITTDIASAPFLWVAPLALYLLTFILAFGARQWLPRPIVLVVQAAALAGAVATIGLPSKFLLVQIAVHMLGFFLTALVCHQALAARRPHPAHLTEFFLLMSVGGVVGGIFNALIAPVIFTGVWEYPLVLVLSCLARPWGKGRFTMTEILFLTAGVAAAGVSVVLAQMIDAGTIAVPAGMAGTLVRVSPRLLFAIAPVCAFMVRDRALLNLVLITAVALSSQYMRPAESLLAQTRSFFGVLRITQTSVPPYANNVRMLAHGTTLHGAQGIDAANPCRPMTYYAPGTPIGQVFLSTGLRKRAMEVAAVGMGAGTVAAYARPDDELRFFEIDPAVIGISTNVHNFSYISGCAAKSHISWVLGDARLSLQKEPAGVFDILLVDAFTSDAVPAHLLTVEAMKMYLEKVAPDGVVIMHLSNRNLDLNRPVAAVAKMAGGVSLQQFYSPTEVSVLVESAEDVIIVGKSEAALAPYRHDPRWRETNAEGVRPWTDDYTNLFSAMIRRLQDNAVTRKELKAAPVP